MGGKFDPQTSGEFPGVCSNEGGKGQDAYEVVGANTKMGKDILFPSFARNSRCKSRQGSWHHTYASSNIPRPS